MTTDQLRLPPMHLRRPLWLPAEAGITVAVVPLAAALAAIAVLWPQEWRLFFAVTLTVNLLVLAFKWPRAAALVTLLFLPFVALIRRLLIPEVPWTSNDPLLLIGPIVAIGLCYRLFVVEKRVWAPDLLSKLVVTLIVFAVVGIFNPFGVGGVVGGMAGFIYLGVPLLWFLLGRELSDRRTIKGLIYAATGVAVVVGIYGLYQSQFAQIGSFPQWDVDWYHITGYSALAVGQTEGGTEVLRPWGTFSSNAEYAAYLSFGIVFAVAFLFHRRFLLALSLPVLLTAVFLASGRAVLALLMLTLVVLTAIRTRNRVLALLVVVVGIGLTYGAAIAFGPRLDRAANVSGNVGLKRTTSGLLSPLDPNKSTALSHWDNLGTGIGAGFTNPVGTGTGGTNIGAKVGGGTAVETDNDIADVFASFGFVGGFAFVGIILLSFKTVFGRYMRGPPDVLLFAIGGILVVSLGNWLQGGHYAAAPLLWFLLGWAARPLSSEEPSEEPIVERVRRLLPAGRQKTAVAATGATARRS